ncbi:ATP-binding cassette domain-containing protein [Flavobacteriales bacterium]|nr:ATP-binding cassette domain-containing protein [Flavobacteriales bacterium]
MPDHKKAQSLRELLWGPLELLTPKERRTSLVILASIFVNSVVDLLGLALVIPVIGIVIRPETIENNEWVAKSYEFSQSIGIEGPSEFVILLCCLLVLTFVGKAILNILINLFQARFSFQVGLRLCAMMWSYYFGSSLDELRRRETGLILTEVNSYPTQFASTFLIGNVKLASDFIMIGIIISGMLVYSPVVVASIGALTIFCSLVVRALTKRRLTDYSEMNRIRGPRSNSQINNAVKGFIEIFTFNAMEFVKHDYLSNNKMLYRIAANSGVLKQAPAKVYEVVAAISISGAIILSILMRKTDEEFLNLLMVLTLATYRIMPTISRVNGQVISLRNAWYVQMSLKFSRDGLKEKLSNKKDPDTPLPPPANKVDIELADLRFAYEPGEPVLDGVHHHFAAGQIHAIVGPSGSGKSTLLNAMLGLLKLDSGHINITLDGTTSILEKELNHNAWLHQLSYLSQQPYFFSGTVRENLTFHDPALSVDPEEFGRLIDLVGLNEALGESPLEFQLNEGASNLSGGQQQRLAFLRAIRRNQPVLILDEATSALDEKNRDIVFDLLRHRADQGANVLLITHDRDIADRCDTVLNLK